MARAWHLKSRPQGLPTNENFELKDIDLPPLGAGRSASATTGCRSIRTCAAG